MNSIKPREYNITLDVRRGHKTPLINISAGDTGSVVFHIKITDNDKIVKIPDDAVVLLYFAKNDDTKTVQSTLDGSVYVVDGQITCKIKTNSIGVSNKTHVEVKIMDKSNGLLVTPTRFEFNAIDTLVCDEDIESTNEYPLLIDLINKVGQLECIADNTFGDAQVVKVKNENPKKITPVVSVFSSGFGMGSFGQESFGGSELVLERCKVVYKGRDEIHIQPNDRFKDLEINEVKRVSIGEYVTTYKDSNVMLYIDIRQEV